MKLFKKMMALVIATAMVVTPVMATEQWVAETNYDSTFSGTLDDSISITGLEEGDAVSFYQVLEYSPDASTKASAIGTADEPNGYDYKTMGASGWKLTSQFKDAITKDEFKAILTTGITEQIAGKIAKAATTATYGPTTATQSNNVYSVTQSPAQAGLYVTNIAPGKAGTMYNPIFVAADYYTSDPDDLSSTWAPVESPLSYAGKSMAKKTTSTVNKTANDANTVDTEAQGTAGNYTNTSETVNVGDTIDFTVETKIPEFNDDYVDASFEVTDTLSTGLQLLNAAGTAVATNDDNSIKVEVKKAATTATASDADSDYVELKVTDTITYKDASNNDVTVAPYAITNVSATGYKITFNKEYLLRALNSITDLKITYKAKVLDTAATKSVNQEDNTVVISFNNNPNDSSSKTKLIDKTNHYTFNIDGTLAGGAGTPWQTQEVVKVGLDENGNEIQQVTTTLHEGQKSVGALAGAKFLLYKDNNGAKGAQYTNSLLAANNYIESDANGLLKIHGQSEPGICGLDAGTYWLEETEAPAGYIKAQEAVKIEIIPTFTEKTETVVDGEDNLTVTVKELASYIVKIGGETTATYNLTNDPDGDITEVNHGDTVVGVEYITVDDASTTADDGKILNTRGTELPSTGGTGTVLLYTLGSILVLAAGIMLVTRRKAV